MMSFSADIKEELSKINNLNDKEALKAEFLGYLLTWKINRKDGNIEFLTENAFNVERFYKILFNLGLNYEPETYGKYFKTTIFQNEITNEVLGMDLNAKTETLRTIVKGAFLSTGSVNNPENKYHLEINFEEKKNAEYILNICKTNGVNLKLLESKNKYILYIKEGEEISKFLALIGANKAVMKFEDIRAEREIKNNVNRKVNCETANLNKTINAAVNQVNDIKLIQRLKKFDELSEELKSIALLRLEYPDLSLKELGEQLEPPLGKSGVNHRMKKIHEFAEELKR
ncbi:MAG: DNA-binding protein WhiA [Clostridia bacterium]|nr:DNA-binding protein WhiA [Clostridia bacterium]